MSTKARGKLKRFFGLLLVVVLAGAVVYGVTHRQEIRDRLAVVGFEPSDRVEQVMRSMHLTRDGERIFLATRPTVDGSSRFGEQCSGVDHSEEGHVLGCYKEDGIHLFDVTDERVNGIVEVTAAHELLHAAYSRMGDGDRYALNEKLLREYERLSADDPELADRMSVYEHLSDAAFANELHSVLGTEVAELPDWLEQHYAQWFHDRASLVSAFEDYHAVFVELQSRADELQGEMTELREDVERRKVDYDRDVKAYNDDAEDFAERNRRKEFAKKPKTFERLRDALDDRRLALEETLQGLQVDIDRYNELRDRLAEVSEVSAELDQQLDSDLAPVTTRPDE